MSNTATTTQFNKIEGDEDSLDIDTDGELEKEIFAKYIISKAHKIRRILENEFSDDIEPPEDKEKSEYTLEEMGYVFTQELCDVDTEEELEKLSDMEPLEDILIILREFCEDKGIEV